MGNKINDKISSHNYKDKITGYCPDTTVTSHTELEGISGCRITLEFADKSNPQVHIDIANLLIDAFVKGCEE